MNDGWVWFVALCGVVVGLLCGAVLEGAADRQSTRAGVMVIDGTAYVLVPAKRGVE